MEKRCLIIDNEDQVSSVEKIERLAKARGIKIICDEFNIGMLEKDELFTENKLDIDKIVSQFVKLYKKNTYHLVAFDWDLGDEVINGVELIRKFQEFKILTRSPKILYSGLLKDEISNQLDKFKSNTITKTALVSWINTLIKVDVVNFVDRTNYEQEIVTQVSKTEEIIDLILEEELKKFPDFKFRNSFVSAAFNGKTFLEIATVLENDDLMRNNFKKEIIQQVISYLTEKL